MGARCRYSHPGTWGHECGKPATLACQSVSESTADGIYWHARCPECVKYSGPDNAGLPRDPAQWEAYDPAKHRNTWLRNRWPNEPERVSVPA